MKRNWGIIVLMVCLMLVLVSLPLASSCSSSAGTTTSTTQATAQQSGTQATTNKTTAAVTTAAKPAPEVRIGVIGGITGPAAAAVGNYIKELEYILKYINEVEGGIDGVKLAWKIIDDKGGPEGAILAYKELQSSYNPAFYLVIEDFYLSGYKDIIAQDKSVMIATSPNDPRLYTPASYFFNLAIPPADGFAGFVKWALQDWKGTGTPKIGALVWDLQSGGVWKQAQSWVTKQGVNVNEVQYSVTAMDMKASLMKLRDANVNYVWMIGSSPNASMAIRDYNGLGLKDKFSLTFSEYVEADVVLGLAGKDAEGFTIIRSESPYSDNSEAAKLYTKIYQWAEKKDHWSDNRLNMNFKAVITAAIKQAAADVGKDKIDKAAIYNALNKLTSIDTLGNSKDFGFGSDRRLGVQTMKISKLTQTGTVSLTDWITMPRTFEGIDK
jgi:ABC-type branched-subunit amino acid transport system substrate-binding protein